MLLNGAVVVGHYEILTHQTLALDVPMVLMKKMLTNQNHTNYTHFVLTFFFFFFNYTKNLGKQNLIPDLLIKSNETPEQQRTI